MDWPVTLEPKESKQIRLMMLARAFLLPPLATEGQREPAGARDPSTGDLKLSVSQDCCPGTVSFVCFEGHI